mmetsp:Transcript_27811/g.52704  ORF Transcript_27811/g.52704 Transcript_27811/m.52704 type:complete len:274 (-) Transcript_27811:739-1560(-)
MASTCSSISRSLLSCTKASIPPCSAKLILWSAWALMSLNAVALHFLVLMSATFKRKKSDLKPLPYTMPLWLLKLGLSFLKLNAALYWHSGSLLSARWIKPGRPSSMISAWWWKLVSKFAMQRLASLWMSILLCFISAIITLPPPLLPMNSCVSMSSPKLARLPTLCLAASTSPLCAKNTKETTQCFAISTLSSSLRLRLQRHAATSLWISNSVLLPALAKGFRMPALTSLPLLSGKLASLLSALSARHWLWTLLLSAKLTKGPVPPSFPILFK